VRILGIESSSARGSVALVEGGKLVAALEHEHPNAHAESLLAMVEELLASAGFAKSSLDRLGVGVGPGSFTGLRVGIALAEGMSLGLDRPLFGIGALRAMARGVPNEFPGPRCALLDARRSELFAAAYALDGAEIAAPAAIARGELGELIQRVGARTLVGCVGADLETGLAYASGRDIELPHARWVAVLAGELELALARGEALYIRDAGAQAPVSVSARASALRTD
jgi:tRNA threonylcarbamoyladenosine biosynthesis protein TsaB